MITLDWEITLGFRIVFYEKWGYFGLMIADPATCDWISSLTIGFGWFCLFSLRLRVSPSSYLNGLA